MQSIGETGGRTAARDIHDDTAESVQSDTAGECNRTFAHGPSISRRLHLLLPHPSPQRPTTQVLHRHVHTGKPLAHLLPELGPDGRAGVGATVRAGRGLAQGVEPRGVVERV